MTTTLERLYIDDPVYRGGKWTCEIRELSTHRLVETTPGHKSRNAAVDYAGERIAERRSPGGEAQ